MRSPPPTRRNPRPTLTRRRHQRVLPQYARRRGQRVLPRLGRSTLQVPAVNGFLTLCRPQVCKDAHDNDWGKGALRCALTTWNDALVNPPQIYSGISLLDILSGHSTSSPMGSAGPWLFRSYLLLALVCL